MSALDADFAALLDGRLSHEETKAFLARSVDWMAAPEALAAGARAMRARMVAIAAPPGAIDVCGTGGDGAHTLNISTAVAFVAAGAGACVAKHGNRAMSSKSGAADVLEALGVRLTADPNTLSRCLQEAGVAFLFAQNHHPAMRHVAAARKELGYRTIFNLLGPLSNPAGVTRQMVGVFSSSFARTMAEALQLLGADRAWTFHGAGGLDELVPDNGNIVFALRASAVQEIALPFIGGDPFEVASLRGGDAQHNAEALRALLENRSENDAYRQIVELNAGASLVVAGLAADIGEGMSLARESLAEGEALARLDALIALSQAAP
ncbi:MAG: anthranilate phosphoribosyltransferase [Alphaproteobacteria bacterium]|nr:anthranilate phosphoribosyltransferase [Alphaproteobacteria bacterium]